MRHAKARRRYIATLRYYVREADANRGSRMRHTPAALKRAIAVQQAWNTPGQLGRWWVLAWDLGLYRRWEIRHIRSINLGLGWPPFSEDDLGRMKQKLATLQDVEVKIRGHRVGPVGLVMMDQSSLFWRTDRDRG